MITLLAIPFGLFHRNRRYSWFLAAVTVVALCAAYGIQPVHWLVQQTPVLNALKNSRLVFVAAFGIAALAGLGISVLEHDSFFGRRRRALALALFAVAVVLGLVVMHNLRLATTFRVEFTRRPSFSRSLLLISAVPILWRLYGGLRGLSFPLFACALLAFDLISVSYGVAGFARPGEIYPQNALFDALQKESGRTRFRVAYLGTPYPPNANLVYKVESADGYEVTIVPSQLAFALDYIDTSYAGLHFVPEKILKFNDRRLDLMNLKYLAVPSRSPEFDQLMSSRRFPIAFNNGDVALFENKSVLPRVFAVPARGVYVAAERDEQLNLLRDPAFDPQQNVILSALAPSLARLSRDGVAAVGNVSGTAEIVNSTINELEIRTQTAEPSVLVVSQTYYPGWQATVDGSSTDLFPADLNLTGIAVPAGVHDVRLTFRPASVRLGALLTAVAGLLIATLAVSRVPASNKG